VKLTRRRLLGASLAATAAITINRPIAAQGSPEDIAAVAFDGFALFDARPVFQACETVAPGRGPREDLRPATARQVVTCSRVDMAAKSEVDSLGPAAGAGLDSHR